MFHVSSTIGDDTLTIGIVRRQLKCGAERWPGVMGIGAAAGKKFKKRWLLSDERSRRGFVERS
jgi:hypothetical protein